MLEANQQKLQKLKLSRILKPTSLIFEDFEVQCNNLEKNAWQQSLGSISGIFNRGGQLTVTASVNINRGGQLNTTASVN